jgi:predicted DNA-binding transcriptional regulator YafY
MSDAETVVIDYTNHRGVRVARTIVPRELRWGTSPWHPEPQWLLEAYDREKGAVRSFALVGIHSWRPWRDGLCEHGLPGTEYCAPCNREIKRARRAAGYED